MTNWKEKLHLVMSRPLGKTKNRELLVIPFISTEIIEKLIEEIPDKFTAIEMEREINGKEWTILTSIKQQLKAKWLGK